MSNKIIKEKIRSLRKKIVVLGGEVKKAKEKVDTEEYRLLKRESNSVYTQEQNCYNEIQKLEDGIYKRFTSSEGNHIYYDSDWLQSNVKSSVVEAIKEHLRISKLNKSEVNKLVHRLVDRAERENKKLQELRKKHEVLDKKRSKLYGQVQEIESAYEKVEREIRNIEQEIERLKDELESPQKYVVRKQKSEESMKVCDGNIIDKIYETFKEFEKEFKEEAE